MGIAYNTSIVRNGLVLHLDAANPKSYPGTGTAWNDLSGRANNGTLTNGPTYNSANNGSIVFDGVNDYAIISSFGSYSSYTFMFFCKWVAATTYDRIFGSDNFGTYTILNPSNVGFHYNPLGGSPPSVTLSSNVNVGYGNWCQVAVTVNLVTSSVIIYINGVARNNWSTLPSTNLAGNLFLGAQNTGGVLANSQIGNFFLYDRSLSAPEIQQNFEALRGRYGI